MTTKGWLITKLSLAFVINDWFIAKFITKFICYEGLDWPQFSFIVTPPRPRPRPPYVIPPPGPGANGTRRPGLGADSKARWART